MRIRVALRFKLARKVSSKPASKDVRMTSRFSAIGFNNRIGLTLGPKQPIFACVWLDTKLKFTTSWKSRAASRRLISNADRRSPGTAAMRVGARGAPTVSELNPRIRKRVAIDKQRIVDAIADGDSWRASELMSRMIMGYEQINESDPGMLDKTVVWADVDELLEQHLSGG